MDLSIEDLVSLEHQTLRVLFLKWWWSFGTWISSFKLIDLSLLCPINHFLYLRNVASVIHWCLYIHWHLFICIIHSAQEIAHRNIIIMSLTFPPSTLTGPPWVKSGNTCSVLRGRGVCRPQTGEREGLTALTVPDSSAAPSSVYFIENVRNSSQNFNSCI